MADPAHARMTAAAFLAWSMDRAEADRVELVAGEVVAMAPERSAHALAKLAITRRLADAIEGARLPCTVYPDGMAVMVDDGTVYEPDASVRCGPALPPDAIVVRDPMIVVEVLSPSTRARDAGAKLEDYFRLPSVRHYLLLKTENRTVILHTRQPDRTIITQIVGDGPIRLDPPGIEIAGLFG